MIPLDNVQAVRYFRTRCRSDGIGRHRGLKIPGPISPCRFESGLRHSFKTESKRTIQ